MTIRTKRSLPNVEAVLAHQVTLAAPYLTEEEFCALYQVATRTAVRWRREGKGPTFVRLGPRHIRYRLVDCESWAASRTCRTRAPKPSAEQSGRQVA